MPDGSLSALKYPDLPPPQIVFRGTKNGEDVAAALAPSAVAILKDYIAWGGNLQDREAPLFLAPRRKPCADNGKAWGGQNKTAFRAARKGSAIDFGRCG